MISQEQLERTAATFQAEGMGICPRNLSRWCSSHSSLVD
jgi:hypothetical protein